MFEILLFMEIIKQFTLSQNLRCTDEVFQNLLLDIEELKIKSLNKQMAN